MSDTSNSAQKAVAATGGVITNFLAGAASVAAGKGYMIFVAGGLSPLIFLGVIDEGQRQQVFVAVNEIAKGFELMIGGATKLVTVGSAIVIAVLGFLNNPSLKGIFEALAKKNVAAVAPPEIAAKIGASNVISTAEAVVVASPAAATATPALVNNPAVLSSNEATVVAPADAKPNATVLNPA